MARTSWVVFRGARGACFLGAARSVWVSIDRTQHALSNYIPPDHPDHARNKDRSCTRMVHMDHLLKQLGFLEFSASNVVFGPMQWGAGAQGRA